MCNLEEGERCEGEVALKASGDEDRGGGGGGGGGKGVEEAERTRYVGVDRGDEAVRYEICVLISS